MKSVMASNSPTPTQTKSWLELSLKTTPELAEAICDAIFPFVEGGVALEQLNNNQRSAERWEDEVATGPVIVRAYLSNDETLEDKRLKVEHALAYLNLIQPIPKPSYKEVQQSDWAHAWKENFKPLRIGKHVVIRPSWSEGGPSEIKTGPGDIELVLDPGMAFGTGLHPTTQLCAAALEERVRPGIRVFDVGSGTAILSICAAKLGAAHVLGVDIEDEAVEAGRANAHMNGVAERVQIEKGSSDFTRETYDIVVANILAGVIRKMLADGLAQRGKLFIFSGILDTQAADVVESATAVGLRLIERKQILDWVCLIFAAD
jgi:ribosomal protein L11 methyltransferase